LAALQLNAAAAVQGTVVDSTSAAIQPIYGARVEFAGASENPAVVRSDSLGRFSFSGIAAGRYRVNVAAEGFIRKSMLVTAATGQTNSIQIPLLPAPTMSGHVRDSYNVPISNILVEAIKVIYGPRGDRSVVTLTSALTDDRGEYHLYWLDPGEYYIRGSSLALKPASVLSLLSLASEPPPFAYSPTYHPGTRDPKQAASIRVRSGVNPGPFDFQMLPPTAVSIQGLVMSLNGPGVCGARIILRLAGASASSQQFEGKSSCNPLALGEYGLGGMPPGSYVISVNAVLDGTTLSLHQKRTLNGIDRAITLRVSPGVSVSGVIAQVSGASINFKSLRVVMDSSDPDLPPDGTSCSRRRTEASP
jgi:hypothetical protein